MPHQFYAIRKIAHLQIMPPSAMMWSKEAISLRREKRWIHPDAAEYRLLFETMVWFRNKLLQRGIDSVDVDRLLIRLSKAKRTNG